MRAQDFKETYIGAKWGVKVVQPFVRPLAHPGVGAGLRTAQLQPIGVDVVRDHVVSFLFEELLQLSEKASGLCPDIGTAVGGD